MKRLTLYFLFTMSFFIGNYVVANIYWTEVSSYGGSGNAKFTTDLTFSNMSTMASSPSMYTDIAKDPVDGRLYWGGEGELLRSDLAGNNIEVFDSSFSSLSEGVAIDSASGFIYWTCLDGKLRRKHAYGTTAEILYDSGNSLHGIAIDPEFGRLFWANDNSEIFTSDLNGSNITFLVDGGVEVLGVAYNPNDHSIYFADYGAREIKRCNPDGTGLEVICNSPRGHPIELNFSTDHLTLYWTEWGSDALYQMNLSGGDPTLVHTFAMSPWGIATVPEPADLFSYSINSGDTNTITITGYVGSGGNISIPPEINSKLVTIIGTEAFSFNDSITHVIIPEDVTSIRDGAFWYCSNLSGVTMSTNIAYIGESAFEGSSLTSISIPSNVTFIGASAFWSCEGLVDVVLPDNITTIEDYTFGGCRALTKVVIPEGVRQIKSHAFFFCTNLESVSFPDSVTNIGDEAFRNCSEITSVIIPRNVSSIGQRAFFMCSKLASYIVDTSNPSYSSIDGVLFDKDQTEILAYPMGKTGSSYIIPNTVNTIGRHAFSTCSTLENITIPNTVTVIRENSAFYACTGLKTTTIPDSITYIGGYTFSDCTSLEGVYFAGDAPALGTQAFNNANKTTVYYLAGTSGWGPTYGGRPTLLWNPQFQTDDANFGMQTNGFSFSFSGTNDMLVVVEASTNLISRTWIPVETNSVNGYLNFNDSQWTNHAERFYRLSMP